MTDVTTGDKSVDSVGPDLGRVRSGLASSSAIDLRRASLFSELHKAASWQDCVDLLESRSHGLLHIATSVVLQRMNDAEFGDNLSSYLKSQKPGVVPLLRILGSSKRDIPPSIIEAIVAATKDSSNLTQEAASRTIAFRAPEQIPELLTRLTPAIAHGLSYSGEQKLLEPILQFWQARQSTGSRYPPSLGFLVTPEWLAKNAYSHTHLVGAVALAFGYIDERWFSVGQEIPRWVADAWRIGINYVTADLEKVPIEELRALQSFSMRQMLPWTSGMYAGPASSEFASEIVRAGFISAVRSFERENLAEKRNESPYHPKKRHNIEWARFCHAPASWCRNSLISKPLEEAKKKGIPEQYWDAYLKEHAVILLELDKETQREAELFFKARWQLVSEHGVSPGPIRDFPVNEENSASFPHLARLVLPKLPNSRGLKRSPLSLGARAASLLFEYCDDNPSRQLFLDVEQHHKSSLPSIGCEIQVPFSTDRESQTLPWKVALRMLGIPSPYRPEYHKLVEASFAPSWSYLVPIGTILSLSRIGLFRENQAIALHISIGAELGDNVKYLLFPQQFITTLHRGKYTPQLMSKGFACTHKDGYSPHQEGMSSSYLGIKPAGEGTTRTEIRSFRIPGETLHSPSGEEAFIEDIACTHLLASAAASDNPALRAVWEAYCREIEGYVETLPAVVQSMFRVNWYEGTGEPYDRSVMQLLPSYRQVTEAVDWVASSGNFDFLQTQFSQMRRKYALQLQDLVGLPSSLQQDPRSFITRNGFTILRPIGGVTV